MAKFTLTVENDYPYFLFGISSSLRGYRLAWNLNKQMELELARDQPLELVNKRKEKVRYSCYTWMNELQMAAFKLIQNRSGGNVFIPEHPRADYLLLVDVSPGIEPEEVLKSIKQVGAVAMAFSINIQDLKSKENLLLTT